MSATPSKLILRKIVGQAVPFVILGVCLSILWPRLQVMDFGQIQHHWAAISTLDWIMATVFTIISFRAVSQYDVIAHRQLDTGLPEEQARRSGLTAIALAQTLGFGLITGTLTRWRMLRGFGPGVAAMVTGLVSITFMLAMVGITAVICLVLPVPDYLKLPAALALLGTVGLVGLASTYPRFSVRRKQIDLPSIRASIAAFGWAAIDVVAAAAALWILIPVAHRPDLLVFLPAFCLALSAGLFSGTPGGAGPFELVLLALTATATPASTPESSILVAVMGFRLVYFAIPACLAALRVMVPPARMDHWRDPLPPVLAHAPRAESAVVRQNGGDVEPLGATHAALWPTAHALVAMYDPFDAPDAGFFDALSRRALDRNRFALIYKASARTAILARRSGWHCLHTADDAILDLNTFDLAASSRSSLRRKLRKATKAGITVRAITPEDLPRMAEIDTAWQDTLGTARGGTMGRFCAEYLAGQRVFVAEVENRVVAFASFQTCAREWALDLMRSEPRLPDGTMHALVHHAIGAARGEFIPTMSLAAVPACPDPENRVWRELSFRAVGATNSGGLRQFKSNFAPRWEPLYLCAPSRTALAISAVDVAREVFRPGPVQRLPHKFMNTAHEVDEHYEVVSKAAA